MRYSCLYIVALMLVMGCDTENPGPEDIKGQKQLQQMELHFPWGQIVYDSMFYDDAKLTRHVNQSTGWLEIITYSFEYDATSMSVFYQETGNPNRVFLKRDIFNASKQNIQTVIYGADGTLLTTYDYLYNADNRVIGRKVTTSNQSYVDSIYMDTRGNIIEIKNIRDNSRLLMAYDENPNPFYQLPLVNNVFQSQSINNLIRFQVFSGDELSFERNFEYQYDPDGYPTQAVARTSLPNDQPETYYFFY